MGEEEVCRWVENMGIPLPLLLPFPRPMLLFPLLLPFPLPAHTE